MSNDAMRMQNPRASAGVPTHWHAPRRPWRGWLESGRRLAARFLAGPDWFDIPRSFSIGDLRLQTSPILLWTLALCVRFATFQGLAFLAALGLLAICFPLTVQDAPLRLLSATAATLAMVELACGFLFRPRGALRRRLPDRVRAGVAFHVEYEFINHRRLPAWCLEFDHASIPAAVERVAPARAFEARPGGVCRARAILRAPRRGRLAFPRPMLAAMFPFHLFRWTCRGGTAQAVTVHPSFQPLRSLSLPLAPLHQKKGLNIVSRVGETPDFVGCREFRVGDDPRWIHWPSSARRGGLVVKECQEESLSRAAVVLDTSVRPPGPWWRHPFAPRRGAPRGDDLEAAISLAAAVADHLARNDSVVDIVASGADVHHFQTGRSLGHLEDMLDILAAIEPSGPESIERLAPPVLDDIAAIGCVVAILLDWDQPRARLAARLREAGAAVKLVVVSSRPDAAAGAPPETIRLSPEEILRGDAALAI